MNIVVLDGYALNPGDLSWKELEALGGCVIHERTPSEHTVKMACDAEIVLTNKTILNREIIARLPKLKYIGVLATGYNVVDVRAARERGIPVCNVPAYGTRSVAQMTFALLLELTQRVGHHAQTVCDGRWCEQADFCYWDHPLIELDGLTLGLVGFGNIARTVAAIARAFGMNVIGYTPRGGNAEGVTFVADLETLLRRSDVVSLHCPLSGQNAKLLNAERLRLMKPGALLVNTARGQLIDEQALADALATGHLAGAALDVLDGEPPSPDNPLLRARNCIITPHIAWATVAARRRLMKTAIDNVRAFLKGEPRNVVPLTLKG